MTPKQKKLKLEVIQKLIAAAGFTQDRYGNYKNILAGTTYRIKIKKINIRIERKMPGGKSWYKITSEPISNIDLQNLMVFLARFNQS